MPRPAHGHLGRRLDGAGPPRADLLVFVTFVAIPNAWEEGNIQGLKARGNFTIGEKWANGVAETFTVRYDGENESNTFTGSYKNITSAKVYEDGKEISVKKDEEKGRISFKAVSGGV